MINKQYLMQSAQEYGMALTEQQLESFDKYAEFLVDYNEKVNLTAITEPNDIVVKHFLDSLMLAKFAQIPNGCKMIDIGTGAGFPSVPVKIYRSDIQLTLLDSLNKRVVFLDLLSKELGQNNAAIHSRAEDAGKNKEYREKYDIATARAVADLKELCEYCLPFVKLGGYFIALKGYEVENELQAAQNAIKLLGGQLEKVEKAVLPFDNKRSVVFIKKISHTPTNYPRPSAKIAKSPL
ncbi:MAG TPA: 16S rRNA (guanine(527)-N(7))-methyltransferase RsmG [Ruminococcaceae bacterium]|nr:16S rRNA (guanine(527)-N(7))-methyltransferase RsmG [Oscillospiraceae bacterium]